MRAGPAILTVLLTLTSAAAAEGLGTRSEIPLATYYGIPYGVTARCLTNQMSTGQFSAMALIFAQPTAEAHVPLWMRGSEHGVPVGVFHIRQGKARATLVSFEETQRGRLETLARAATVRCAW